ncbi:hypothetical protein MesoLj113c_44230 [Mesorhizobium sp. 113-3-9]|nr:hypothetical protein MesoLj113c_44230 [Mesorhizobium sp. 113-3-9]
MTTHTTATETRTFEANVARLLHIMVHSVYSDRDVFLRELISNAADACEKLRYESISRPELLGDDPKTRITLAADPDRKQLIAEDNGMGMSRDEMAEALAPSPARARVPSWSVSKPVGERRNPADRPVRCRFLLRLHGGCQSGRDQSTGGQRGSLALVL